MNIAKKYLEQAYIGYHRIICYDLMIKGIQEDLSKFNNDKIIIPRLKAELISYEKQRRYWLNKRI